MSSIKKGKDVWKSNAACDKAGEGSKSGRIWSLITEISGFTGKFTQLQLVAGYNLHQFLYICVHVEGFVLNTRHILDVCYIFGFYSQPNSQPKTMCCQTVSLSPWNPLIIMVYNIDCLFKGTCIVFRRLAGIVATISLIIAQVDYYGVFFIHTVTSRFLLTQVRLALLNVP